MKKSILFSYLHSLKDYAEYTGRVRAYAKEVPIEEAVERAITECIREGILAEFLSAHRSEAKKVSIYEYDEEKHMRLEREESYAEGVKQGIKEGVQQGIKEGVQQEKLQTIRKMLLDGLPTEKIKQYTDAADEEITKAKSGL